MKDLKWIRDGYFAHRGLHNKIIPENSLAAFKHAVQNGYHIELDIRITKDNKIVVIHDGNLKRLTGCDIIVEESTYSTIKEHSLLDSNECVPLLSNVLSTLPETTEFLIELKSSKRNKDLATTFLELMTHYQHKYAIHSFDPRILHLFKKLDSTIIRGQISKVYKGIGSRLLTNLRFNFWAKPDFINYNFDDLPRKQLDKLKENGMMILSYVARNEKQLAFVKKHYDNAVFEQFEPKKKVV